MSRGMLDFAISQVADKPTGWLLALAGLPDIFKFDPMRRKLIFYCLLPPTPSSYSNPGDTASLIKLNSPTF
jgi:hypothetical protein